MLRRLCIGALSLGAVLWLAGCGGGSNSSSIAGVGAPGTVRLLIGDALPSGVSEVNVTITGVSLLFDGREDSLPVPDPEVNEGGSVVIDPGTGDVPQTPEQPTGDVQAFSREGEEPIAEDSDDVFVPIFQGELPVNLLSLANQPLSNLFVTDAGVPSGYYKKIRIYMQPTGTVVANGETYDLRVMGGGKVEFPIDLYVSPGETEIVLADYVLLDNINLHTPPMGGGRPYYTLTPRLRMAMMRHAGSATGTLVLPADVQPLAEEGVATLTVTAQGKVIETGVEVEAEDGGPLTGKFTLHGLPLGTYDLTGTVEYGGTTYTLPAKTVTIVSDQPFSLGEIAL